MKRNFLKNIQKKIFSGFVECGYCDFSFESLLKLFSFDFCGFYTLQSSLVEES